MDETGFLTRPKLRAAYERIADCPGWPRNQWEQVNAAEAFLRTIAKVAVYRGITFDQCAEQLGY